MYEELVKRLRAQAVYLPEKFSKNAELLDVLMKAADAIEELIAKLNHADEQVARLVEAAEERRWVPVAERLPNKDDEVLIYGEWVGVSGTHYKEVWMTTISDLEHQGYRLIAWMPIPELPKEERS